MELKKWKREGYTVVEREFDYDLHVFAVIVVGKKEQIITPDSIESMKSIIESLDNGEDVDGWEDGMGNTIYTGINKEIATVTRVSDNAFKVEYEPMELEINLKNIAGKFGKCEFGEIIYVKVDNELKLKIYWDDQTREYKNVRDRY